MHPRYVIENFEADDVMVRRFFCQGDMQHLPQLGFGAKVSECG